MSEKKGIKHIVVVRNKAKNAVKYWEGKDPMKCATWLFIVNKSNKLLCHYDEVNKIVMIGKKKAKLIHPSTESTYAASESTNEIMTTDGTLKKVNDVFCYIVLYCIILYCHVLCYVVLCCIMVWYSVSCSGVV